jgi:putative addiction module component (TIGR02574 family)
MTVTLQELKSAASALPIADRAELARFLLGSLDEGEAVDARAEWLALAERRMAEVKAGQVVGVPADEVLRTLLAPRP